jgi:signal transduction histidine kinase
MRSKKRNSINIIFWICIFICFIPRITYEIYSHKLSENLNKSIQSGWTLRYEGKTKKVDLPINIKPQKNKSVIILEKEIDGSVIEKYERPSLVLGRMADSDKVYFNGCYIGEHGFEGSELSGYYWNALRKYEVPLSCLQERNKLKIETYKVGGPGYGVIGGPIGIGEYKEIYKNHGFVEFFWSQIFMVFGIILIALSIYYFLVYQLVQDKKYNLYFSISAFAFGIYEIVTSAIPYKFIDNATVPLRINMFAVALGSLFFIVFLNERYSFLKKSIKIFYFIACIPIIVLFFNDFNQIYKIFETWFLLFLLSNIYAFVRFTLFFRKESTTDAWRYLVGFSIFFITSIHDIVITNLALSVPYLFPYGFACLIIVAAVTLAKEYADAFLYVEAQVEDRTRDLNKAIEDLKGLEKMKERFFANISHDLKTPITVALGAIEETKSRFANVLGEALSPADRALHKLKGMVSSILDSVKAESGELKLQWQSVHVQSFMEDIAQDAAVLCRQSGVKFDFDPQGFQGLHVPMDSGKMQRVMENIISNAVKYTAHADKPQKKVEIQLETDQSNLHIYVDDSGVGVPESERASVFDRYVQSSLTDLKVHGGSGIGLSFVREMIDLHNGDVSMLESPMGGSRVHIQLPLSQDVTLTDYYEVSGEKNLRGSLDVQYPPTTPEKMDPAKPTLLICEDNPEVAQIIWNALQDDYNVYFAENGKAGLDLLERVIPDCILSDVQMPILDGHGFLAEVRKNKNLDAVPFIYLTSLGADQDVVEGFQLGASDYIAKPFKKEVLLTRVRAHVQRKSFFERLTRSEKMSTIGTMFAGIAHEMKNPLQSLVNNQSMIQKIVKDRKFEDKYETLERAITSARKKTDNLTELISTVNEYSSGSEMKTKVDLKKKTQDVLNLLENKRKEKNFLQVEVHMPEEDLMVEGFNSIQQAMMNLISNAFDATDNKQTDRIDIYLSKTETHAIFEVQDTGSGIPPHVLPHIFDPFVTTKDPTKGTGLGLFLSKTIVEEKHGGSIQVQTQEGKGTRFIMSVPLIAPDHDEQNKPFHSA